MGVCGCGLWSRGRMVCLFFFFQAEDGIRDFHVTGVQTCALPISWPRAPWQDWHFSEYTLAPAETEPLPAGSPTPSGATVMSSLLISSGVSGRPRLGCCALHTDEMRQSAVAGKKNLNINMFHRPIRLNPPALNTVEVIELDWRILRNPSGSGGLHFALLISGSAHQR